MNGREISTGFTKPALVVIAVGAALVVGMGVSLGMPAGAVQIAQADVVERTFWESVRNSTDPAELAAYLETYPNGHFAPLARLRLKRLKKPKPAPARPAAVPGPQAVPGPPAVGPRTHTPTQPVVQTGFKGYPIGDQGWIGVEFKNVTAAAAKQRGLDPATGVLVVSVSSYAAAGKAGIKPGDIILTFDRKPAVDMRTFADIVKTTWPGRAVEVGLWRDNARIAVSLTVGGWFTDATKFANQGNADAMHRLGLAYETGRGTAKNPALAAQWYQKGANAGSTQAQFALGRLYSRGLGVAKNGPEAATWYRKAAARGHVQAQLNLARLYHFARGVARNYPEAAKWYRAAADQGHREGQTGLGFLYEKGLGVARSPARAAELYRKSAAQGDLYGLSNLAGLYWNATGVARDRAQAAQLWRRAALRGHKTAITNLKRFKLADHDLAAIQRALNQLGYDAGAPDGKAGSRTRSAILQFQRDRDLLANGKPSRALHVAMIKAIANKGRAASATPAPPGALAGQILDDGDDFKGID
jgi:TPR repeat protein